MRLSPGKRSRRTLMAGIMLVAFALRVLLPPGSIPGSSRPFLMEICSEGLSADMLEHVESPHADSLGSREGAHHRHGTPSPNDLCVFGTAGSAGPIPRLPPASDFSSARQLRALAFASIVGAVHRVHLPQPRAPPGRL